MKRLLYVYPNIIDRSINISGVDLKVKGQISAFRSKYHVKLACPFRCYRDDPIYFKFWLLMLSQIKFIFYSLKSDLIYYRYDLKMLLYNFALIFISMFSTVWIEHNTVYKYELRLFHGSFYALLHRISMLMVRLSKSKHIAVTKEIKYMENLPKDTIVMPNGYSNDGESVCSTGEHNEALDRIKKRILAEKAKGNKIFVFVGSDFPWHGIERIANLIAKLDKVFLLLIGPIKDYNEITKLEVEGKCLRTGYVRYELLPAIYEISDFGLGTFALEKNRMIEACPLKVREYLWYGLPVIINYYDPLLDNDWSRKFIFRVNWNDLGSLINFVSNRYEREHIKKLARYHLSWEVIYRRSGII